MLKTVIFLSVIFTVILKGNSLNCYVCYNCDQVKDDYVASCEDLDSNSTSSTTTTSTTSTTPTTTSTESSSTTDSTTNNITTTITETTSSSNITTTEGSYSYFVDRDARANNTYECFQGKITVNNTQITVRGCAINRGNGSCESFGLASCSVCSTDKCNGSGSIQSSIVILAVSLSTYLFKK